jgi:hypothetical protein
VTSWPDRQHALHRPAPPNGNLDGEAPCHGGSEVPVPPTRLSHASLPTRHGRHHPRLGTDPAVHCLARHEGAAREASEPRTPARSTPDKSLVRMGIRRGVRGRSHGGGRGSGRECCFWRCGCKGVRTRAPGRRRTSSPRRTAAVGDVLEDGRAGSPTPFRSVGNRLAIRRRGEFRLTIECCRAGLLFCPYLASLVHPREAR